VIALDGRRKTRRTTTTPSDTIQKREVHLPVRRKLFQNAMQAMAKYDAGIARERMENPL
jgi:hypothetical protein